MDGSLRERLAAEVLVEMSRAGATVEWGVDDCVRFVANPIARALGRDPVARWRGTYACAEGAHRVIGPMGLGFMCRHVANENGWRRIDPEAAQAGDIGLCTSVAANGVKSVTTAICRAPGWFVMRSENGWLAARAGVVRLAWSVL